MPDQTPDRIPDRSVLLDHVSIRFGNFTAVDNANLKINSGEFFSFLGPSGCGKTTMLRCISGFSEPTEGKVLIGGKDMAGVGPNKRPTALIFQHLALFPLMTVAENIAFPLEVRGVSKKERRKKADELLEMIALPGIGDKKVSELSGGQKQRVAIARALAVEPDILLLDEPLSALDLKLRQHMRTELRAIQKRVGVTFIYITHDQGEALTMSDRVAVFHQGEIQQIAPPRDLYEAPHNTFVAQFIGENNRLAGELVSRDGEECVVRLARGEEVRATAVNVGAVGEAVSLSIRPERIRLNGHSEACPNRFSGRIAEFIYLGDHVRIRMEVCGKSDFYVKQPVAELDPQLAVGDLVPLGWSVEHVRALDPLQAE